MTHATKTGAINRLHFLAPVSDTCVMQIRDRIYLVGYTRFRARSKLAFNDDLSPVIVFVISRKQGVYTVSQKTSPFQIPCVMFLPRIGKIGRQVQKG